MKKIILFSILTVLILSAIFLYLNQKGSQRLEAIQINGQQIFVEIAKTPAKQAQGLSGRQMLPENQGMLFVFDQPQIPYFWMKDMLIPLDFIWINNSQIIAVTENVQPQDYQPPSSAGLWGSLAVPPKTLPMDQKVDMVLEVNAGTVNRLNIKIGDKIEYIN